MRNPVSYHLLCTLHWFPVKCLALYGMYCCFTFLLPLLLPPSFPPPPPLSPLLFILLFVEWGGSGRLLYLSLKKSLLPAMGWASVLTLRTERAGGLRRNFLMSLKLVVSFLSQKIISKVEAVLASLVQEKTATMPAPLFYFTAFWNTQVIEEYSSAKDSNNTHISK